MHWIKKVGNESCSSRRGTSNDTKLDPPLPPPGGGDGGKIKNLNGNPHFLLQIWILQKKVQQFDLRVFAFWFTDGAVIDKNQNGLKIVENWGYLEKSHQIRKIKEDVLDIFNNNNNNLVISYSHVLCYLSLDAREGKE